VSTWSAPRDAGSVAIPRELCSEFGSLSRFITNLVPGVTPSPHGHVALVGVKIGMDSNVDFADHRDLVVAGGSPSATTRLGVEGMKVAGTNIAAIALGAVMAPTIHLVTRPSPSHAEVKRPA